ncbi:FAD:protein FMN transferase [Azotosporobacter soli]|uniref:FAD:protein FMN transferase n=1 Tax=Azotosporobacter soli TaxID=3055040 RepID=UPI0031FEE94A
MNTFHAMNTDFLLAGLTQTKAAAVQISIQEAQHRFSRFEAESEISRINRHSGQWLTVSELTFQLLQAAIDAYEETDGLFHPFLGEMMQQIGYDRSFEHLNAPPDWGTFRSARVAVAPTADCPLSVYLELEEKNSQVRLTPGVSLDLGGIAKGWIAQQNCDRLQLEGVSSGLIDAGGDVVLWGRHPQHTLWGVGVASPGSSGSDIAALWCEGTTAIATSSIVKRRWRTRTNKDQHHIIDPRSQGPADSDLLQVTVLARDLISAEQYAKCLLILGSQTGFAWLQRKKPTLAFIAVRSDGRVISSDNLHWYCSEWEVQSNANVI